MKRAVVEHGWHGAEMAERIFGVLFSVYDSSGLSESSEDSEDDFEDDVVAFGDAYRQTFLLPGVVPKKSTIRRGDS